MTDLYKYIKAHDLYGSTMEDIEPDERTLLLAGQTALGPQEVDEAGESGTARKRPQVVAAIVASMSALCIGLVLGYSSPTIPTLVKQNLLNEEQESWFASIITLGALCGGLGGGAFVERLGRKGTCVACGVPFVVGWLMVILASPWKSFALLIAGRFLTGIAMGTVCIATPTYIAEISQSHLRGTLGAMFQLFITCGILLAFVLGMKLAWQMLALASAAVCTLAAVLMLFVPESPRFLALRDQHTEALEALQWLRGPEYDSDQEYYQIMASLNSQPKTRFSPRDLLSRSLYQPLLMSLGLMVFQQFSGVNNFILYTKPIFQTAGFNGDPAIPAVIVGAVQVGATFLSLFIMDFAGRRLLLMISGTVMALSCGSLGLFYFLTSVEHMTNLGWLPILSLNLYIIMFSLGWGPIPWLMMSELMPTRAKGVGTGLATAVNWLSAFIVTKEFLAMQAAVTQYGCFWVFGGICTLSVIYVFFFLLETKGKSLDEIEQHFERRNQTTE